MEENPEAPIVYVIDDDAVMREADFFPRSKPAATGSPACAGDDNDGIQALAVGH
jgi:hypothetical protein